MPIAPNKFEKSQSSGGGDGLEAIVKHPLQTGLSGSQDSHDKGIGEEQSADKKSEAVPGVVKLPLTKIKARGHGPVKFDFEKDPQTGNFYKVPHDHTHDDPTK